MSVLLGLARPWHPAVGLSVLSVLVGLILPVQPAEGQQVFKTESGTVTFTSEVPTHSFSGTSNHVVGRISLADSTVDFYVDVHTLDTGIARRDRDMLETLHAEENPFAEFYGTFASDVPEKRGVSDSVTVAGTFTVNGVSQEVQIDGVLERTAEGLRVSAEWTIRLEDYNIEPPGILFYRVDQQQDISLRALLTPVSGS